MWKNAYLNCGRIRLKALPGREVEYVGSGEEGERDFSGEEEGEGRDIRER